ncbi:MAG: hypothetical protein H6670_10925 [Anaerolineaceae bacterium]|nr:hypothetical protein [Anaerolineaceae bacterium]
MTSQNRQSVRVYARITPELHTLLQQVRIAKRIDSDAEIVRAALRAYLDRQSNQVASKRHFSYSLQQRLSYLDWHLSVITTLLAQALAMIITAITGQKVTPDKLLEQSIRMATDKHNELTQRLNDAMPGEESGEFAE